MVIHREAATFPTTAQVINAISTRQGEREQNRRDVDQDEHHRRTRKVMSEDEIDQVKKVRQLAREGIFWCGRRGEFVPSLKLSPRKPEEMIWKHVTREKILAAWQLHFDDGPTPPEPTGTVTDDALGDLFG